MNPSLQSTGFSPERLNRISILLQGYVDRGDVAGMIATVARHGRTAYYEKFGWMDREARQPMRDDAIFMIASMTKPVTSVAMMMLYEAGHFQLNTPIAKFIPAFNDSKVLVRETDHGYCRSMYVESPDGLITEFTADTPDAARIDAIRRADAHSELARWMAGDHRTNNDLRVRETA